MWVTYNASFAVSALTLGFLMDLHTNTTKPFSGGAKDPNGPMHPLTRSTLATSDSSAGDSSLAESIQFVREMMRNLGRSLLQKEKYPQPPGNQQFKWVRKKEEKKDSGPDYFPVDVIDCARAVFEFITFHVYMKDDRRRLYQIEFPSYMNETKCKKFIAYDCEVEQDDVNWMEFDLPVTGWPPQAISQPVQLLWLFRAHGYREPLLCFTHDAIIFDSQHDEWNGRTRDNNINLTAWDEKELAKMADSRAKQTPYTTADPFDDVWDDLQS